MTLPGTFLNSEFISGPSPTFEATASITAAAAPALKAI
jgi:hypothetical protein